jgi:predicted outer membrane protein
MSASCRVRLGLLAIGMCGFALTAAVAQQATNQNAPGQPRNGQSQTDRDNQVRRGERTTQAPAQPGRIQQGRQQQYSAAYRGTQAAGGQGPAVDNFFASCLMKKNQGEIELAQLATQQSQNPQVKEFAQMLVKDHQKMGEQLQQIASTSGATSRSSATALETTTSRTEVGRTEPGRAANEATRPPGSPGTDTAAPGRGTRETSDLENRTVTEGATTTARQGGTQDGALMQVASIEEKIADRCHQAMREELQQKTGAEFDECFVGAQVGGHIQLLAALDVLSQESQGQLKQIADEAKPHVQQHLDQAKQLAKQLKGGSGRATAQRPSAAEETQR